ncbi:hypothetical protein [Neobacillus vireti]|uniref:Uncharacterized protein n=1 Tax=Neobacillus vireti LMG 21834 TaxID=1131730 RepID=A0AB94ING3_9BACI|nr:hypothetical protein [Neobacillus vireti]ETI68590.1 hypothetical protein BAVI_11799 [Neobacillus vireti LMG 21834]KLT16546.1 hypothetical protein AA980_19005 [Neobacillus vireti]
MLVRVFQWLAGVVLFLFGLYLIFGIQEFFGTLAIIAAFFIFPRLEKKDKKTFLQDDHHQFYSDSELSEADHSSRGKDTDKRSVSSGDGGD